MSERASTDEALSSRTATQRVGGHVARVAKPVAAGAALLAATALSLVTTSAPAHAAPTFSTTADVGRRTAPTAAPDGGYGMAANTAFTVICQTEGQPHGRFGNRLYFLTKAPRENINIFIPDAWTNSPHLANQPPIPGIPMCGARMDLPQQRQSGAGNFRNAAVADYLLARVGQYWGEVNGECRQALNIAVAQVSNNRTTVGGHRYDYNEGFRRAGAHRVPGWQQAVRGDVVQVGSTESSRRLHTYVIVANHGNGTFQVVDSNSRKDKTIRTYNRAYDYNGAAAESTIWRLGQV